MAELSLLELNRFVRRVMALNFPEAIWIEAEVAQANESRGHYFLSLVQKAAENDELLAQAEARLWASQLPAIRKERGRQFTDLLRAGLRLRLQLKPVFHERFGFSYNIIDVDPAHTEGLLEITRRQTIQQLQLSGDLQRNAALQLPLVPQRLAVISSESAAGYADFKKQLAANDWGYSFDIQLFPAAMQGDLAAKEISKRFREIGRWADAYDAIVLIRGGGSKMDLLAFDDLELCRQLALSPLAVITGIGHEIDESVADLVAHTALKTPTAVATFLLDRAAQCDAYLQQATAALKQHLSNSLQQQTQLISNSEQRLNSAANRHIALEKQQLFKAEDRLALASQQELRTASQQLDSAEKILQVLDPAAVLARGYALISKEGQVIPTAEATHAGEDVEITWNDGKRPARILKS